MLRGSGNGTTGYRYLTGVDVNATYGTTIDNVPRTNSRRVQFALINNRVTLRVDLGAGYQTVINAYDLSTAPGQVALPSTLKIGVAASTGGFGMGLN